MRIGNLIFKPRLLPTVITLMLLPVLISLGIWQLGRADEKRVILAEQAQKAAMPALSINANSNDEPAEITYRELTAAGKFDSRYRIYIDNKVHQGNVGYQIVEPFVFEQSDNAILVNRGWIAATSSRLQLPEVTESAGTMTIYGIAKLNTRDVASFGSGNRSGKDWPALVRWIDISDLQTDMPYTLKPYLLLQSNDNGDGLIRDWKFIGFPAEKNESYALQWFSLAAMLSLIYVIVNMKKASSQDNTNE